MSPTPPATAPHAPRLPLLAALAIALAIAPAACRRHSPASLPFSRVLLISIDTCRPDYLGCYGNPDAITPNLDALARESTLFLDAISPCPLTLPAHCSMLTGTEPAAHGVHDNFNQRLPESSATLAEILRDKGFNTAAIVSAFVLDYRFGLHQGFDHYDDTFSTKSEYVGVAERRGDETSRRAIDWLQANAKKPFFLFLHYYDPHYPYVPPEPFTTQFATDPYAGEIAFTDHCIGSVIQELKRLKLYDSTLIVITGDHGESLGEHGESKHGYFIYQSTIRIPMLLRIPGAPASTLQETVGLIDIVPTILGALQLPPPATVQGRDLSSLAHGNAPTTSPPDYHAESLTPTQYGANPLQAIVRSQTKYILTTRPEFYDLPSDPHESSNRYDSARDAARTLNAALSDHLLASARTATSSASPLDAAAVNKLRSLGYAGGTVTTTFEMDPHKADPKDLVSLSEKVSLAIGHLSQRQYAQAITLCTDIAANYPDLPIVQNLLGEATAASGDLTRAETHYRRAVELEPHNGTKRDALAGVLAQQERYEEALIEYRAAVEAFPDAVDIRNNMVGVLIKLNRLEEAVAQCRTALAVDARLIDVHANLAYALELLGRDSEAREHYAIALQGNSEHAEVHNTLANHLLNSGRIPDAIAAYERALVLNPDLLDTHFNLGTAYSVSGDHARAAQHFELILARTPDDAEAHTRLAASLASLGQTKEATQHADRALQLAPDLEEARQLRATLP